MSVQFNDSSYRFAHGRRPRGNGSWAFYINGSADPVFIDGPYGQAKAQAVKIASAARYGSVVVGS